MEMAPTSGAQDETEWLEDGRGDRQSEAVVADRPRGVLVRLAAAERRVAERVVEATVRA